MEFVANFMTADVEPRDWARRREAEGWTLLGCADHFFTSDRPYPHLWVTLTTFAAATKTVGLTSSFANNLFRSPVEFAQASLQLHAVSGGRFEAGLGAGWARSELEDTGIGYPPAAERAGRYYEAIRIVAELFKRGRCSFHGEFYDVEVPALGPIPSMGPPPLVASLGGKRTIREIAPLVDRVELKLISEVTRAGHLDLPALADIPRAHLGELVERVRAVNPDVALGVFILCSVGTDERTKAVENLLGDSFLGGFFGAPEKVASSMHALADAGISRVQVSPFSNHSFELLAPYLGGS